MGMAPASPRQLARITADCTEVASLESIADEYRRAHEGSRAPDLRPEQHIFYQEAFALGEALAVRDYEAWLEAGVLEENETPDEGEDTLLDG